MDYSKYFKELCDVVPVTNALGSSKEWPKPDDYDSWIDYWSFKKGIVAKKCYNCEATQELVGAHVIIEGSENDDNPKVYLTILCKPCNNSVEPFEIFKSKMIDVSDICPFSDIRKYYKK